MKSEFEEFECKSLWSHVYNQIHLESSSYKYSNYESRRSENKYYNRYYDVTPYDHSRICLKRSVNDYINANLVQVESADRAYILTQGPLPVTIDHFWLMVWEQNSRVILMLNRLIERGVIKCTKYWPDVDDDDLLFENFMLKLHYISKEITPSYIIRHFSLTDLKSQESREIAQYHYISWPDFGIPESPASFLEFLFTVRESGALSETLKHPPIVHCSAGIGRSGTWCLVDACLILFERSRFSSKVDVRKVLMEMRKYRQGLIQTAEQLRFSYLAIIEGINQLRKLNKVPFEEDVLNSQELNLSSQNASSFFKNEKYFDDNKKSTSSLPPLPPRNKRLSNSNETEFKDKSEDQTFFLNSEASKIEKEVLINNNLNSDNLRRRTKSEKNKKLEETLRRIKKKQKESEARSRLKKSIYKFGSFVVSFMFVVGAGYMIYYNYYLNSDNLVLET